MTDTSFWGILTVNILPFPRTVALDRSVYCFDKVFYDGQSESASARLLVDLFNTALIRAEDVIDIIGSNADSGILYDDLKHIIPLYGKGYVSFFRILNRIAQKVHYNLQDAHVITV